MTLPIFPALPGLGYSQTRTPTFSTRRAPHVSGREVVAANYAHGLYAYELTINGLDSAGAFPGLGVQSLQSLLGFFNAAQGSFATWLYVDPDDCQAVAQAFGTGDGATTSFTLYRSLGGAPEPVSYAVSPAAPSLAPSGAYLPNNLYPNSSLSGAVSTSFTGGGTLATGLYLGGEAGFTYTVTPGTMGGVTGVYLQIAGTSTYTTGNLLANISIPTLAAALGQTYIHSWSLALTAGALPAGASVNIMTTEIAGGTTQYKGGPGIAPTSTLTRYFFDNTTSTAGMDHIQPGLWIYGATVNPTAVNFTVFIGAPQLEIVNPALQSAPGAFIATFGTPSYGAPQLFVNGVAVSPSTYSLVAPNGVTFSTPPALGAALTWSGSYAFQCRFTEDTLDFEKIMNGLWTVKSVKFRQVR